MRFYALTDALLDFGPDEIEVIALSEARLFKLLTEIEQQVMELAKASNSLNQEVRLTTRRKRDPFEIEDEGLENLMHMAGGHTFINLAFDVLRTTCNATEGLYTLLQDLRPGDLFLTKKKHDPKNIDELDALQHMLLEFQMNKSTIDKFVSAVLRLRTSRAMVYDQAVGIEKALDAYYQKLQNRHTTEGIEVHIDPVVTDIAMSVFENVDAHGEIQDGKNPNELSAYSKRKATIIADAVKKGPIYKLIDNPKSLTGKVAEHLRELWSIADEMSNSFSKSIKRITEAVDLREKHAQSVDLHDLAPILHGISEDLDPNNIVYKVVIVGELNQDHRVKLLQQFTNFMPQTVQDDAWEDFATKLDGATGDVIRKIVDHVWRTKMTWFTENHRVEAQKLVDELNKDEKFQIANFDSKKRDEFKKRLAIFTSVTAIDLEKSIDVHLANVAIHHEIETAKKTYSDAKSFLAQIKKGEV